MREIIQRYLQGGIGTVVSILRHVVVLTILIMIGGCGSPPNEHVKKSFFRIATSIEITIVQKGNSSLAPLWKSVDSLLIDWERRFSSESSSSEIGRLNGRTDSIVPVSPQLAEIVRTGLRYGDSLNGAFDITVLPLKQLYGLFDNSKAQVVPSPQQIQTALNDIDYHKVHCADSENVIHFRNSNAQLDLGGLTKGFAIAELGRLLDRNGLNNYLVVAGGDVLIRGKRKDNTPWRVGIKHPRKPQSLLASLALNSGAIVTSGDYEHFWIKDGLRYHHIFDTKTGTCCRKNQSVTIWGSDPIEVDILSTGLFCFEGDSIIKYIDERARLECVVVDSSGLVHVSEGWKNKIEWIESP